VILRRLGFPKLVAAVLELAPAAHASPPDQSWIRRMIGPAGGLSLVVASLVAMIMQDHSGLLPLGLVNESARTYRLLSLAWLVVVVIVAAVFSVELWQRRPTRPGTMLRRALVCVLLVELLLAVVDIGWISREPRARLGGPYWERRSQAGEWVFLKRARDGSPYGFRFPSEPGLGPSGMRLLFLGDSYTEGSGRSAACNYPEVVARSAAERLGASVEVLNAGVAGYGPVEEARLLSLLVADGLSFDAVVVNLFLENDFTDNLPGTDRRIVFGMIERFPRSPWLRYLHPLNLRVTRLSRTMVALRRLSDDDPGSAAREEGACRPEGETLPHPVPPDLRALVDRRLQSSRMVSREPLARRSMLEAVREMRKLTDRLGVPLIIVLFPDRIHVDQELRRSLRLTAEDVAAPGQLLAWARGAFDVPVIDTTLVLADTPNAYRARDTHLNDRGNIVAGQFVASRLTEILGRDRARFGMTKVCAGTLTLQEAQQIIATDRFKYYRDHVLK